MKQEVYYQFPKLSDDQQQILSSISFNLEKDNYDLVKQLYSLKEIKLKGLTEAIKELGDYGNQFVKQALPKMSKYTLEILANPPKKQMLISDETVQFSRKEIYQILSLSFFGLLINQKGIECPHPFNLTQLLQNTDNIEKIKCYIHYFLSARQEQEDEIVIYERIQFMKNYHINEFFQNPQNQVLSFDLWNSSTTQLQKIEFSEKLIEEYNDSIIVDFANKYIGGGVLTHGCVQEEILFTIMTETIIAVIFSKVLSDQEVYFIRNAMRYSNYKGYGRTFQFIKSEPQNLNQDILVLDALNFSFSFKAQFKKEFILRELNKAFLGFGNSQQGIPQDFEKPISTGKWGCGAFSGDVELKIIIQLIAYSVSRNRNLQMKQGQLFFSTFKDNKSQQYQNITNMIIDKYKTVGNLCKRLFNEEMTNFTNYDKVFTYLLKK